MTYSDSTQRNDYTATSGQTVFAYDFRILANSDLDVYVEKVLKTLTTDYTVSGAGDAGGGNVTFGTGITLDEAVMIIRDTPDTQATDFTPSGPFPADSNETALDKLAMKAQDIEEKFDRAFKFAVTSTLKDIDIPEGSGATDRASKVFAYDTAGTSIVLIAATNVDSTSLIATKGDQIQGGDAGAAEVLTVGTAGQSQEVVSGKSAYVTAKTLSDFTNANHDHSDAANGGSLTAATTAPVNYRSGFNCKQASTITITVEGGVIDVDGTVVTKTSDTTLTLTTAGDWVDDTSDQATSTYGYIYINAAGKIEMDDVAPDESDTSGNTTGILRYNDTGTDTTDRRLIGWFFMNSTGSGELSTYEVGNLKDGDVHNSVVRTDSTQDTVNDTTYGVDLTNTQVHFYSSGRGPVEIKCHMNGDMSSGDRYVSILNDGSDIAASQAGGQLQAASSQDEASATPTHAEVYSQGGITFEAKAKVGGGSWVIEEKTMIIQEA